MKSVFVFLGALAGTFLGSFVIYNHDAVGSLGQWCGVTLTAIGIYIGISNKSVKLDGAPLLQLPDPKMQSQGAEQTIRARIVNKSDVTVRIQGVYIILQTRFFGRTINEYSVNSDNTQNVDVQPNDFITSEFGLLLPISAEETKYKKLKASVVIYHSGIKRTVLKKKVNFVTKKITFDSGMKS